MGSKRTQQSSGTAKQGAKRAKTEDSECAEYEVALGGDAYIDVDKLFHAPAYRAYFNKQFKRSVKRLIEEKELELVVVTKTNSERGELVVKSSYAPKTDVRLVKKDEKIERIIALAQEGSHELAPPVIEDKDLVFFKDAAGNRYHVEMRGTRTMEGIRFKAKDVGKVFQSDRLADTIQYPHSSYLESTDFVWFTLPAKAPSSSPDSADDVSVQKSNSNTRNQSKELFLTFQGLVKMSFATRMLGCNQPHGEIYLIRLEDRLYMYGKTWYIDQRFKTHQASLKSEGYDNIEHVYSAKVDIEKLSAAETAVKKFLQANNWYRSTAFSSELCGLDDSGFNQVKEFYDQLQARHFSGNPYEPPIDVWKLLSALFTSLSADAKRETQREAMELLKLEHAAQLAEKDRRIAELEEQVRNLRSATDQDFGYLYAPHSRIEPMASKRLQEKEEKRDTKRTKMNHSADFDVAFYVDKAGVHHHVEMRGSREMEGIYFKAKDVGQVIQSDRLVDTILDARSSYRESVDLMWLDTHDNKQRAASDIPEQEHTRKNDIPEQGRDRPTQVRNQSRELFLTFEGLMHALHGTRTPVAREFRTWVYSQVFAIAYGTPKQKKAMVAELCRVDKCFLEAFMKLIPNDIACLYLVDTNMRLDDKKVIKFGRSEKLKERFFKHCAAFGVDTILDTVVFIPEDRVVEAELLLKNSIAESLHFSRGKDRELLLLSQNDHKVVRTTMQTIADKFNGSMTLHAASVKSEMREMEFQFKGEMGKKVLEYEVRIKDLEGMVKVLQGQVKQAVADEMAKATKTLADEKDKATKTLADEKDKITKVTELLHQAELKLASEMCKVGVLQRQLAETEKATKTLADEKDKAEQKIAILQQANIKLRFENLELKHAAEIAERDRRIAELQSL